VVSQDFATGDTGVKRGKRGETGKPGIFSEVVKKERNGTGRKEGQTSTLQALLCQGSDGSSMPAGFDDLREEEAW